MATGFETAKFLRNNKTQALGFGIFTVVVVLVLISGAIIPSFSAVIKLQSEIKQKRALYNNLETKVNALSELSQQIDNADNLSAFNNLPLLFPADRDYSLVLLYIDDISRTYKYELVSISFPTSQNNVKSVSSLAELQSRSLNLNIRGSSVNLVGYLKAIEALPMYPTVESVSYNNSPDRDGNYSFSIRFRVYEIDNSLFYK